MFAYQRGDEFKRLMDFDKKKIPTRDLSKPP